MHQSQLLERPSVEQFQALFEPRGVVVAGASSHPGKFGFVSLHNILAGGFQGQIFGTNLQGENVLGIQTVADIDQLPENAIDLVLCALQPQRTLLFFGRVLPKE